MADPFGGVGLGSLYAADSGLSWVGVELERDFVILSHRNFYKFAKERWCTCGFNGDAYLCSMRESISKDSGRAKSIESGKDRTVLQPGLPKQISLFGEEVNTRASSQNERENALEQREVLESRDAPEIIRGGDGWQPGNGEERELERREKYQAGWVYTDSGEWQEENGTHSLDGATSGENDERGRSCSSQERESTGQPNRESGSDDNLGTHEITSSERGGATSEGTNLRDMRGDVSISSVDYLQPGVQAAKESAALAKIRRETEGKYCQTCGKLIVPFPILLQGDSRRLSEVIGQAVAVVSSPPYSSGVVHDGNGIDKEKLTGNKPGPNSQAGANGYGSSPGQLGSMPPGDVQAVISSPPFAGNSGGRGEASRQGIDAALFDRHGGGMRGGTGSDPANLDNLPQGNIQAVISSPPYATGDTASAQSIANRSDKSAEWVKNNCGSAATHGYGSTEGQLGAMKPGDVDAVISSPPFASVGSDDPEKRGGLFRDPKRSGDKNLTGTYGDTPGQLGAMKAVISSPPFENQNSCNDPKYKTNRVSSGGPLYGDYGSTSGQIDNESGSTFWEAARDIVNQCHLILTPGGYAIWVVKNYVKAGKVVDFTGQWIALCEACGFELLHHHRAMLVKNHGSQTDIFGETHNKGVARKSFFRQLHERRKRAATHWGTLTRDDKAALLWLVHNELWTNYHQREDKSPVKPSTKKILSYAQTQAWVRDGKIGYEIETSIDWESVICMRKV